MSPRKISAKEVIIDISTGLSNDEIGKKYGLSEKGTQRLLDKLLGLNLLTREEHYRRLTSSIQSIDLAGDNRGRESQKETITDQSKSLLAKTYLVRSFEETGTGQDVASARGHDSTEPPPQPGLNAQEIQRHRIPASPEFIDVSKQGENQWWRYLVSIIFILVFSTIMSAIAKGVLGINAQFDKTTGHFIGIDSLSSYILLHFDFLFIFVTILLAVRYEHKRPILSLITPNRSTNWKNIGKSFGVFWALLCCLLLVDYIVGPESFQFSFDPARFLLFAPAVLILTPIQTTAEELFFRGYLLQMMALLTRNRVVLVFISGILFMLPHLVNPEVASGFLPMSLYYFAVGGFLTFVTLKSNSLEVAIGIHGATNLFAGLVANYSNSSLKTEPILFCSEWNPIGNLVSFCVIAIVFYLVFFGGRTTLQKLWAKSR